MGNRENQNITIDITGLTHKGEGVGRLPDGMAVFVPGAVPGEKAAVQVVRRKKNYAHARLLDIIAQADERCRPQCAVYGRCGGCTLQHIEYQAQLRYKTGQVKDSLSRIGKLKDVKVLPTLGMERPWHYRNKVHFQVQEINGRVTLGYFEQGSHCLLPLSAHRCLLVDDELNEAAKTVEELLNKYRVPVFNWQNKRGLIRHVVLRKGAVTGEVMVVLVTGSGRWDEENRLAREIQHIHPRVASVVRNINQSGSRVVMGEKNKTLAGKPTITDRLGRLKFNISPNSFYQVNPAQTLVLYNKAREYAGLTGKEKVLDAYCGIGTIALFMAGCAGEVMGLEIVPEAVKDAEENAKENGIDNVEFYQGEVERLLPLLSREGYRPDVVVLDPPRRGCGREVLSVLAEMKVPGIVYVSCDPGTLARDLSYLNSNGFEIKEVQPVDMFPQTAHVECVVKIEKK
ncbi:23S rRNA (uracil1939-C5)-methyltransferase [Desulfohalotomaculum tongense]|uniref:23S rRNA (uracil(1939)-C(5))-methyltransferase RlmD n=1 Tax=Desulforadius tongensis TaxID=1216062 RepID=UPI001A9C28AB|nr:23S rRNA (uracil(1939)-C(5))-methyltransferase RlmD [Desulforadius tongensis]MBM7854002.1 23S rRNA (uracil1939-C5)-methyltransferase [Desulforadius tongensis]